GDGDKKRQRAKQGTMRVHQDAPPGKAFWRAVLARHASPQSVSEQSGSQQRSASEPAKAFAGSTPARSRTSSASFSCTPKAGVTLKVTCGNVLATWPTMRGMSLVECRPGESM